MNQLKPSTKRQIKAREIYQNTFIKTMAFGFVLLLVLQFAFFALLKWSGLLRDAGVWGGGIGIGSVCLMGFAQNRASRALVEAGLVREQTEIIERSRGPVNGEILELRESTLWGRLAAIAFLLLMGAGCVWLLQNRLSDVPSVAVSALRITLLGLMAVQMLINIRRPELRMDERGITVYQSWVKTSFVPWERVAALQLKRTWGLPPDYSLDEKAVQTAHLKDERGRIVLALSSGVIGASASEERARFIAELRRRLAGGAAA